MTILDSLRFVQGAVATKDFIPVMTHFSINKLRIASYNGRIALSSPIEFDIDCNPKAFPLIKAIGACEDQIKLSMTTAGKLAIKSGRFKANIDCIEDASLLGVVPEGMEYNFEFSKLIEGFEKIAKFIGTDASRPWSNGILLHGQSIYATNNVCLVECWIGENLPTINIPQQAITEILRIKLIPINLRVSDTSASFIYSDDCWLRTQLLGANWPDIQRIINVDSSPIPIAPEFLKSVVKLKPFLSEDKQIHITPGLISTHENSQEGTSIEFDIQFSGIYNFDMLALLDNTMVSADFTTFPKPALFFGDNLRGAIVGVVKR